MKLKLIYAKTKKNTQRNKKKLIIKEATAAATAILKSYKGTKQYNGK